MSTVELLRAHAPSAPEELHRRVLMLRPVERRRRVRPVLVLAAAGAIAVLAAVVHGFSTSSPSPSVQHTYSSGAAAKAPLAPSAPQPTWTTADSAGSGGSTELQAGTAHRAVAVPTSPNRLQHTDAS